MEASEKAEPETAPETLPEVSEAKPKSTKLIAVVVVVVLIVAALAAAWGLGLFGGGQPPANVPPSAGARATTAAVIDIGDSVTFESTANDTDGTIAWYGWDFGDGVTAGGSGSDMVNHTFDYGGVYWVYHNVTDNDGANATNEAAMVKVTVNYYVPNTTATGNATAPKAVLFADKQVVEPGTNVSFYLFTTENGLLSNCYGIYWNGTTFLTSWENLTSAVINFGDGTAPETLTLGEAMSTYHNYTTSGRYVVTLNVTADNGLSTVVKLTVHVLTEEEPYQGEIKNPNAFIYVSIGEPDYLDPAIDYETAGGEVLQNIYETLVWYDGASASSLIPQLAVEVPTVANGLISSDGLNYTFNLRAGVKFHNGEIMDADDVVYSLQRVLRIHDPSGPGWMIDQVVTDYLTFAVLAHDERQNYSTTASWINAVLPADPFAVLTEEMLWDVLNVTILKVDSDTIKIRLTHPYPGFIQVLAFNVGSVVSQKFVEDNNPDVGGEQNTFMNKNTCGTGPYKLVAWESGVKVQLTRFDDYRGAAPDIKDIFIVLATDVNTRILMLKAGDADSIDLQIRYESSILGNPDIDIFKGSASFDLTFFVFNFNIDNATANTVYGGQNISVNFFGDVHVRRAFSHLFNFTLFLEQISKGNAIQPNGVVPKGMFAWNASSPKQQFDLAAAEAEFKLAINPDTGNSWWDDGFTIPLFYNAGNTGRQTACQYIQDSLRTINPSKFDATINTLDWPIYLDEVYDTNGFMPLYAIGWGPDYADPDDYTTPMLDGDYGTYPIFSGYYNSTINNKTRAAAAELDTTARAQLYSELADMVYEDCPYIWMTQPNNFQPFRTWINGYFYNPMHSGLIYATLSK